MYAVIKKKVSKLIFTLHELFFSFRILSNFIKTKMIFRQRKSLFLFATPDHGNIGDHAITLAEIRFIKKTLKDSCLFEISFSELTKNFELIKKAIKSQDIILYQGGGNMGIEYWREEELFRRVIMSFPNNKIIRFPQTVYYGASQRGAKEFERSIKIYSSHSNLTLCARERSSFELMKNNYKKNKILFAPDIVMFLNETKPKLQRNGVLLCLRSDNEGTLNSPQKNEIRKIVSRHSPSISIMDNIMNVSHLSQKESQYYVNEKLNEYKSSRLVITNRLHGMIFAAITATPCIVIPTYNHKLTDSYLWLEHLGYIKMLQDISNLEVLVKECLELSSQRYCLPKNGKEFEPLRKALLYS